MVNMLCNTHKISMAFSCVLREVRIIMTIVDFLPEVESKKRTYVIGGTSKLLHRNRINGITESVVKEKNNIQ